MASWQVEPERAQQRWLAYRQTSPEWPPLYHGAGEPYPTQEAGRWHRLGRGYCQYFSLTPAGAWAECVRYLSIRSRERAREQLRNLWVALVDERDIADLSTFEKYDRCGLDPRIAVGEHTISEKVGDDLRAADFRGVLSPSAALAGAVNLTVFGERYEHVTLGDLSSWRNPDSSCWIAVQAVAELTGPPGDLCYETCFLGAPHLGYRKWLTEQNRPLPADPP